MTVRGLQKTREVAWSSRRNRYPELTDSSGVSRRLPWGPSAQRGEAYRTHPLSNIPPQPRLCLAFTVYQCCIARGTTPAPVSRVICKRASVIHCLFFTNGCAKRGCRIH